ncbi:hypothetical protein EFR84_25395 [Rhizobium chutanense]|uniref:Propionyl-coenzyme A carboxylase alpha polypeptide n=1 Tax=Rhizobium chutanense TaxID=2035448 RepID=A0A3S0QA25_9HYPH|nr:hypothetical protein EFR84_25395 [Rhizobium chutanense]
MAGRNGFPKQRPFSCCATAARERWSNLLPISTLVGEMPGRAEGGVTRHDDAGLSRPSPTPCCISRSRDYLSCEAPLSPAAKRNNVSKPCAET